MSGQSGNVMRQFMRAMFGLSVLSVSLFMLGVMRGDGWSDWYLLWNLVLAWVPLGIACWLSAQLRRKAWSSWVGIGLTLAWLLFVPNSFYIVSDFIHLQDIPRQNILYDSLTFTAFVINGLLLGYSSLYLVQRQMIKRGISRLQADLFAVVVMLLCSFAIYLGRDLRWNSWDVLVNPAGIIFDISERLVDPMKYPETFTTTGVFFVFLAGLYWVLSRLCDAVVSYGETHRRTKQDIK